MTASLMTRSRVQVVPRASTLLTLCKFTPLQLYILAHLNIENATTDGTYLPRDYHFLTPSVTRMAIPGEPSYSKRSASRRLQFEDTFPFQQTK